MESSNHIVTNYVESTKNTCICVCISIILILLFVFSPLNKILIASVTGKISIIIILLYSVYILMNNTYIFTKKFGVNLFDGSWNKLKTNISCSYIFALFLLILIVSLFI